MPPETDALVLERFRAAITARMGLTFDDNRASSLAAVLSERSSATHLTPERYVESLSTCAQSELHELARSLTVPETYFFRNQAQLDACMEGAVPACLARRGDSRLRILSAACASGEEPYTLAMLLRERWPAAAPHTRILGVDINQAMLQKARRGRYSPWSLRETPPALKERYFRQVGTELDLDPSIRDAVSFESINLVEPEPSQLMAASYDIVFCRNALMYFTTEQFARAVGRLARALVPGGFFFLGHAETLRGMSHDFHLCHAGEAFYYQRKEGPLRSWYPAPADALAPETPIAARQPPTPFDDAWFDTIAQSAGRVTALRVERPQPPPAPQASPLKPRPDPVPEDDDQALLQAVVAAQDGRYDIARNLCESILQRDELNAGAQYVLALCHEHAGDADRAIYHDQLAAYLDPGFAMPRVHLGLLYKRRGEAPAAGRELREARKLIEREDASRLLLFGGGFGRAALLSLCDAELATAAREAR